MLRWNIQFRAIQLAAAGACLLSVVGGCHFHRTGHGFIARSQWSLELDTRCACESGDASCKTCPEWSTCSVDPIPDNAEFLSWRERRRNHRLLERLFHREETTVAADEIQFPDDAALSRAEPRRPDLVNE